MHGLLVPVYFKKCKWSMMQRFSGYSRLNDQSDFYLLYADGKIFS